MDRNLLERPLGEILERYPAVADFMSAHGLSAAGARASAGEILDGRSELAGALQIFLEQIEDLAEGQRGLKELEIVGGHDKSGQPEAAGLRLIAGDVVAIVGPTGAGKSRLLEDIECLAQGDSPTGRVIRIDGREPTGAERFDVDRRLVAQLSQNMNFVMDLGVRDFLLMHAESRMIQDAGTVVDRIFETANELAGESFAADCPVTDLSGGQSRALMIADCACLSRSPVVLIDEIENAGIDRDRALALLVREEKIVLLVTHDPELALFAPRRLVIRNGGISAIVDRTERELQTREELAKASAAIRTMRHCMRSGRELLFDD